MLHHRFTLECIITTKGSSGWGATETRRHPLNDADDTAHLSLTAITSGGWRINHHSIYRIITILSSALSCLAVGRRRRLVVYAHIFMSKHIKTMHECRLVLYGQYLLLLLLLGFIILWSVRLGSLRLYPDKLTGDRSPPTSRDCASCPLSRLTGLTSSSRGSVDSILLIYIETNQNPRSDIY